MVKPARLLRAAQGDRNPFDDLLSFLTKHVFAAAYRYHTREVRQ